MFVQFKKLNNESGMILFIVLMTAIIIMIFSVSMLSQSINEINYAQQQIDQIAAEEMSKGMWWNAYAPSSQLNPSMPMPTMVQTMAGRTYQASMAATNTVDGITSYNVITTYNTFE